VGEGQEAEVEELVRGSESGKLKRVRSFVKVSISRLAKVKRRKWHDLVIACELVERVEESNEVTLRC